MIYKILDKNNYSIKKILNNNGHYVIFSEPSLGSGPDDKLGAELNEIGITDRMFYNYLDIMNQDCYYLPNETSPIYHCGTLFPTHNITIMYPFFGLLYMEHYIDDVIKSNSMMNTKEIYFSHHHNWKSDDKLVEEIVGMFEKKCNSDNTIYFLS